MIKQLFPGDHQNHKGDGYYDINPLSAGPVLIESAGKWTIVDPGAFSQANKLLAALEAEGLKPEDISYVLLTHYHLDHSSNNYLFKDTAPIYTRSAILKPTGEATICRDRELHEELMPEGVRSIMTPGHTMSHVSYVYEEDGITYVCAGDAVREDLIRGENGYSARDEKLFKESMKKIFEIADVIFPGHGRVIEGELLKELKQIVDES